MTKQPRISLVQFVRDASSGLHLHKGDISGVRAPLPALTGDPENDNREMRQNGCPTDADMQYISRFISPEITPDRLFAFDCYPSTQKVDSYMTRMHESSLRNYASDALLGRALQNSHNRNLPLGRTFYGEVTDDPNTNGLRTFASAYMLRNNSANGNVNTNDVIDGINAGTIFDVSIGFVLPPGTTENNFNDRGWFECNLCNQDWLMADPWSDENACRHWPGEIYEDAEGGNSMCFLNVWNARLSELSPVYDGACDGAVILKAKRALEAGTLNRSQVRHLEHIYNTRITPTATFGGWRDLDFDQPAKPERTPAMANENEELTQQWRAVLDTTTADLTVDDARLEGARLAVNQMARQIMSSRRLSDEEVAVIQEALDQAAVGQTDRATEALIKLLLTPDLNTIDLQETEPGEEIRDENVVLFGEQARSEGGDPNLAQRGALVGNSSQVSEAYEITTGEGTATLRGQPLRKTGDLTLLQLTAEERRLAADNAQEVITLRAEVQRLKPLATIGERYRTRLLDATADEAVRAYGEQVNRSDILRMLQRQEIEDIETQYRLYKRQGDARLGRLAEDGTPVMSGGRQTQGLDPNANPLDYSRGRFNRLPERVIDPKAFQ